MNGLWDISAIAAVGIVVAALLFRHFRRSFGGGCGGGCSCDAKKTERCG
ncbi:MAG TPA: FeoB-associated Cys-rich membrane protein [Rhodospirillaceae bacterium]|nr:FeoB-associated Cys-rich membrane protein [Rhodospirillaceae bacterium]